VLDLCGSAQHEQAGHHFSLDGADQCGLAGLAGSRPRLIGRAFSRKLIGAMACAILMSGVICLHRCLAGLIPLLIPFGRPVSPTCGSLGADRRSEVAYYL
jgi:hypothetical protein